MYTTILHAHNLSKTYTRHQGLFGKTTRITALDQATFSLAAGTTLAVVGESGSGKSTLARCLTGLILPDTGQIFFNGEEINQQSQAAWKKARRHMQMVFQDPYASLNPRMKIGEIVAEGLRIHISSTSSERYDRVAQVLERVGLSVQDMNKYPHEFSGGQRQRIGIARSLILKPKLLIFDEAVSALDVSIQAQIIFLLKQLQQEMQLSYLFISHDLRIVRQIAHNVLIMRQGTIVEQGTVNEIYDHPQHTYTHALLAAIPGRGKLFKKE